MSLWTNRVLLPALTLVFAACGSHKAGSHAPDGGRSDANAGDASGSDIASDTGGASGTTGAAGAAGTTGTGGTTGAAGAVDATGAAGAVDATGAAGAADAADATGAGGASGTTGAADAAAGAGGSGSGGAGGAAGAPACATPTRSCYSGAANTSGVGACRAGTQTCMAGVVGPCTGEVFPTPEACNGVDDNCNNMVDEGLGTVSCGTGACRVTVASCMGGRPQACVPGAAVAEVCGDGIDNNCNGAIDEGCACVHVAPTGNDGTGTGTAAAPFLTINRAITAAGTGGLPRIVCVAASATCAAPGDYPEAVVMRDGVHVYGGYASTGVTWPRNPATCVTRILAQDGRGVFFDSTVVAPTILDGFTINASNASTNAAVTVQGSKGAQVSGNVINGGNGMTSIGVDVVDQGGAATPRIAQNTIVGGNGTALAVGVRVARSAPVVQNNCQTLDASGRCMSGCNAGRSIRGRAAGGAGVESYGVQLVASPGALVDVNAICASPGTGDVAAVRLSGDATGTVVRANNLFAGGSSTNAVGFWADACAGAAPWVVNNYLISGNSPVAGARADGVRAVGDCHPVIDSNVRIVGGVESAQNDANGVLCARDAATGRSSRCTVLNNTLIQGAGGGFPPRVAGVRCGDGACARIENNVSITGQSGVTAYGVVLGATGTFVSNNRISAGCGLTEGVGLLTINAFARVQNNVIEGSGGCANPAAAIVASYAVRVMVAAGSNEVDLHSNDLLARGAPIACTARALAFDVVTGAAAPVAPLGIVRNNILHPGTCSTRLDLAEMNAAADPRIVERNDFWFQAAGDELYRNENATSLTTAATVNALADITAAGNISVDPMFTANNHLPATSACVDTGTATGAPATDFEGQARPAGVGYDIGADEYRP